MNDDDSNDHIASCESLVACAVHAVQFFYQDEHPEIPASHGWAHVAAVHRHARLALNAAIASLSSKTAMEIEVAALLHDVDDRKYFPPQIHRNNENDSLPNARAILQKIGLRRTRKEKLVGSNNDDDDDFVRGSSADRILAMISWVSCSENGNRVPAIIARRQEFHWLIPRWADRLEAVGMRGVVRCYQFCKEEGQPLFSDNSPRPTDEQELWQRHATPKRFQDYNGTSSDMISHYYDKLLHIARPPPEIVQNAYLEQMARQAVEPLVQVCLTFGRTGRVDEDYIMGLIDEGMDK